MSQHDLNIANQGFPAFRADLNDALVALGSTNSGATAPATPYANQLWYDTANNILKIRNEDNDAWISIVTLDQSGDVVSAITAATVNAGALNATGNVVLGDASTDTLNVGNGGLVKDASGNVGVGVAAPFNNLQVLGTIKVATGNAQGILALGEGAGATSNVGIWRGANNNPIADGNYLNLGGYDAISFAVGAAGIGSQTQRMLVDTSSLSLVGLQGIKFQATQSASSDANTLDDYEEGTWTPSFSPASGSATYTNQQGTYVKIGRQVTAAFYITVNVSSSFVANGVQGLPFSGSNTNYAGTSFSVWSGIGGYSNVIGLTGAATTIQIRSTNSATSPPVLNTLSVSNGAEIAGTITYFTT